MACLLAETTFFVAFFGNAVGQFILYQFYFIGSLLYCLLLVTTYFKIPNKKN